MTMYYYQRWSIEEYFYTSRSSQGSSTLLSNFSITGHTSYSHDEKSGTFKLSDHQRTYLGGETGTVYLPDNINYMVIEKVITKANVDSSFVVDYHIKSHKGLRRLTLIDTIKGYEDQYPHNGIRGSYWYVRKERINTPPSISIKSLEEEITLFENSTLNIQGVVSDLNINDTVTVKYKVNNGSTRNIIAFVSRGTSEDFSVLLTYKNGELYEQINEPPIITNLLDTEHIIVVWAEDSNGSQSEKHIINFTTKRNRSPNLEITEYPLNLQNLIATDTIQILGKASDPDDNAILKVTGQINNNKAQAIPIKDGEWSFSFAVKQLKEGDNTLTFEVADQYGATDKKQVKLTNNVHASPAPISVARYKLDTPEPITDLIMWIKHKVDADIKAYASIVQEGELDNYVEMTRTEGTSPTGVLESEFTYSADLAGANAKVKIVNADQAMMIMGGMSNAEG